MRNQQLWPATFFFFFTAFELCEGGNKRDVQQRQYGSQSLKDLLPGLLEKK